MTRKLDTEYPQLQLIWRIIFKNKSPERREVEVMHNETGQLDVKM